MTTELQRMLLFGCSVAGEGCAGLGQLLFLEYTILLGITRCTKLGELWQCPLDVVLWERTMGAGLV